MSHQEAAALRRRATNLRTLANQLEHTPSMHLDEHIGVDTWFGPRPDACRSALKRAQSSIRTAIDDLRSTAWRFDEIASELDAVTT